MTFVSIAAGGMWATADQALALHRSSQLGTLYSSVPAPYLMLKGLPARRIRQFTRLELLDLTRRRLHLGRMDLNTRAQRFGGWLARQDLNAPTVVWAGFALEALKGPNASSVVIECGSAHPSVEEKWALFGDAAQRSPVHGHPLRDRIVAELELASRIIVQSRFAHAGFIEAEVPSKALRIVPLGVDTGKYHPRARGSKQGRLKCLVVSRHDPIKGIIVLLSILDELAAIADVWIVGRFDEVAKKYETPSIRFLGNVAHARMPELYRLVDITIVPSLCEGFSLVALESLSSGVPVVGTSNTALPDLLQHGGAVCVPPGDGQAILSGVQYLVNDRGTLAEYSVAARRSALHYDWVHYPERVITATTDR